MKKIIVLMLCFMLCSIPCLALEESSEPVTGTTTEVTVEKTTEKEETTKKQETTEKVKTTEKTEEETEKVEEPVTEDNSQPRLMVTDYTVENSYLTPEKEGIVTVTVKNMHPTKSVKNIKLSIGEESDEIRAVGMGTQYVSSIGAGGTYIWEIDVVTIHTATVGEHKLVLSCDYEDANGSGYSSSDVLRVEVKQPVKLTFDGAKLPVKVYGDDTVTVDMNLINTGKTPLYNCKVIFDIEGLESGGNSFAGEIPSGESKTISANLRVDNEKTGKVSGLITVTYEDAFGKEYKQTTEVKTVIEEKIVQAQKEVEKEPKNPLWWLFILVGLIVGGGVGFGVPFAINSKKQREEDEKRL